MRNDKKCQVFSIWNARLPMEDSISSAWNKLVLPLTWITSERRTFATHHHSQVQLRHHNCPDQLKLLGTIYIRHFFIDLASSCIVTRLVAVAASPHSRWPRLTTTPIFAHIFRCLLLGLLLGQKISCILDRKYLP